VRTGATGLVAFISDTFWILLPVSTSLRISWGEPDSCDELTPISPTFGATAWTPRHDHTTEKGRIYFPIALALAA